MRNRAILAWRHAIFLLVGMFVALQPGYAQFLFCPTPCPVNDLTRLPDLQQQFNTNQLNLAQLQQTRLWLNTLDQTMGDAGGVPFLLPFESGALGASPPSPPLDSSQILPTVKRSLFDPAGAISVSSGQLSALQRQRAKVSAGEGSDAMAVALQRGFSLPRLSLSANQAMTQTRQASVLRADLAAHSGVALLWLGDLLSLRQSLTASLARESSLSSLIFSRAAPAPAGGP